MRFIVDGHQVDTCTIYYDLEFIAEIFDSGGVSKGIHRYSFANQSIRGPMILSNDFSHPGLKIAKVRGISLICKVRNLGSLPGPAGPDSPAMEQAKWLQASFAADKLTYETWSNVKEVEYTEDYIVGTDEMVCSSGSLQDTALPNDQHACAREHQATQALIAEREKKFGKVILPN
ncbi:MAG TPA: hypothetical protein VKZ53_24840 [Candidatus Angelobacter sp.]|nr:hypothetical protein [Candidatus Angelobacter sp.]